MRDPASQDRHGFTLIELLIGMSIFLLILLGIYQMYEANRATYVRGSRRVDVQQNARVAIDEMAKELRMAGYFPENFTTPAASPLLTNAIQVGTDAALVIYGDVDASGTSSIFMYCLDTSVSPPVVRRGKGAADPATSKGTDAAAYTCSSGIVLAENITSLGFQYYDTNNALLSTSLDGETVGSIPAFGTTTNRRAVRTVVVTLTGQADVPGQAAQQFTLTSSVRLRNLN